MIGGSEAGMMPAVFHQNPYDRKRNDVKLRKASNSRLLTPGVRNALVTVIEGVFLDSFSLSDSPLGLLKTI